MKKLTSIVFFGLAALLVYITIQPRHLINNLLNIAAPEYVISGAITGLLVYYISKNYHKIPSLLAAAKACLCMCVVLVCTTYVNGGSSENCLLIILETLLGFAIAVQYNEQEQCKLFNWVFAGFLLINIAMIIWFPLLTIMNGPEPENIKHAGAWRGVTWHKSEFGSTIGMIGVFYLYRCLTAKKRSFFDCTMLIISIVSLGMSHSVTSIIATAGSLVCMCLLLAGDKQDKLLRPLLWLGLLLPLLMLIFIFYHPQNTPIPTWFMKEPTLSNRSVIWKEVIKYGMEKPLLGYGLNFWANEDGQYVIRAIQFNPSWVDNGFIEVFINAGFIGLLVLIWMLTADVSAIRTRLAIASGQQRVFLIWAASYLVYFLLQNITESYSIRIHNLLWIVLVSISLRIHLDRRDRSHA